MSEIGIFIQARMSSTRLPGKVLRNFHEDKSLLYLISNRIKDSFPKIPIVIVTSREKEDDAIADSLKNTDFLVFRGDNENVLNRFIKAAEYFGIEDIVRVCSDNPFILSNYLEELLSFNFELFDYVSFSFEGRPVIKCHFGLFAERIKLKSLKIVQNLTTDPLYYEHVTNYVYENPGLFKIKLIDVTGDLTAIRDIRLTVDNIEDFNNAKLLYATIGGEQNLTLPNIIKFTSRVPGLIENMAAQKIINSK